MFCRELWPNPDTLPAVRPVTIGNRRNGGTWWRAIIAVLLWLLIATPIVAGLMAYRVVHRHAQGLPLVPDLAAWKERAPRSTTIVAADNSLLAEIPFKVNGQSGHRIPVEYEDIPLIVLQAILAAEDVRFFEHSGVDLRAVVRSARSNYRAGRVVAGASTITQQLARNLVEDIGNERSLRRKIREALLARRIEKHYDKQTILAAYANYVFLGANAYGVAAAARAYFSKSLSELNLSEAALIAGLIQIPGRGDPYKAPELAQKRRNVVLDRMLLAGFITSAGHQAASSSPVRLTAPATRYGRIAPWMTEYARSEAQKASPLAFARGGLRIETTVEPALSASAEASATQWTKEIAATEEVPQVAALVFDHRSGYVEIMVGGTDWSASKFNRVSQGCRQPGSAFKPLVYGAALESEVITPATALRDGPISEYSPEFQVYWKPTNSGRQFRGVAIAQDALAASLNTPAVDAYDRVGGDRVIDFAKRMGIRTPLRDMRPLALGALCVVPMQLATSFAIIARQGKAVTPQIIKSVRDRGIPILDRSVFFDGHLRASRRLDQLAFAVAAIEPRILGEDTAYQLTSMLRAVVTRGTATAAKTLPMPVAGKTGTTNDNTDAWFVGFGARSTAAVWLGHDDPATKLGRGRGGSEAALPLWKKLMSLAHANRPIEAVLGAPPASLQEAYIDRDSGLLAAPKAGGGIKLFFKPNNVPTEIAGAASAVGRDFARSSDAF